MAALLGLAVHAYCLRPRALPWPFFRPAGPGEPGFKAGAGSCCGCLFAKTRLKGNNGIKITPSGRYDFVTMSDGIVRVARQNSNFDYSTHLGLSGGKDVAYAGSIRFANNMGPKRGTIVHWKNDSGHYQPSKTMACYAKLPLGLFLKY